MEYKFSTRIIELAFDVKFYPDFHWLILASSWMLNNGSAIKFPVSYSIQYLNHGPEQCWPGCYHCPFPLLFPHSHSQSSTLPLCLWPNWLCHFTPSAAALLVSPPSMSNQPWGLESSRMWYPTHDGKLSWQARMTLSDVPPHFIGLGPSAFNTFSKGLTNLSLPEYPVKGKFHGLIQPAKAWLPRSTHPCVFAPLLRDQCTWSSFLVWGSVRGAAVNVSSPTRLPTGHSSNIKFDEPTHSPLHIPRKAVYPGVHSATFSQGIGPSRNKCQQHAYSRPHPHGQDVSERLSGTPTNSPLPTFWPCRCVQLYTCGWHLFLVGRTT